MLIASNRIVFRKSQQEGDERGVQILDHNSKRRREDSQQSDALRIIRGYRSLGELINDLEPLLEDLIRKPVREELEHKISSRTTVDEVGTCGTKFLELVFKNELPDKIYTSSKIKCVKIALYDTRSQSIVTDGPLSSIKVEIFVLNGDFDREDWTTDEFDGKILSPRDNKGRLLKGETNITLENGVGYIPDFEITDNSSWIRDGRFRLGVKVLQSNLNHAINIKEGRSNRFIVLDARGKSNQKDCAPSINDEICCLKHIPKNGITHQRLRSQGISTVKDLLQELEVETNPSSLKKKFGKISTKYRDEIIEHAKKAKDVDTCVAEATFDGWNYHSEKNIVNSDKREAYKNLKDQVPIETIQQLVKSLTQTTQHGNPNQHQQQLDCLIALQEEMEPPNWSAGGQFVPGPSHNIDDGNIWGPVDLSQIDQIWTPLIDPLFFDSFSYGDGAEPSNHSSFPPDPKGKRKMV